MRSLARRVLIYWSAATLGPLVFALGLRDLGRSHLSRAQAARRHSGRDRRAARRARLRAAGGGDDRRTASCPRRCAGATALAGGIFVAIGFEVAKLALAWYLEAPRCRPARSSTARSRPSRSLLIWIYTGWLVVLFGAVIATYAPSLQMHMQPCPTSPVRFRLAVACCASCSGRGTAVARGWHPSSFRVRCAPIRFRSSPARTLIAIDWVGRLDETGGALRAAVRPCDDCGPLLAQLLVEPATALQAFWQHAGFDRMTVADLLRLDRTTGASAGPSCCTPIMDPERLRSFGARHERNAWL